MKGCLIAGAVALLVLVLVGGCGIGSYNGIVSKEELTKAKWTEIQNMYQRRYDLVPQLVEVVKGAANFEQSTITAVTEARASVGKVALPATLPDDPAKLKAYIEAQQSLSGALTRLLANVEAYPQLKATQNFASLQDEIAGTENCVAVARRDYIDAVNDYNTAIRRFPGALLASLFGFQLHAQLEVPTGVTERPKIDFGK